MASDPKEHESPGKPCLEKPIGTMYDSVEEIAGTIFSDMKTRIRGLSTRDYRLVFIAFGHIAIKLAEGPRDRVHTFIVDLLNDDPSNTCWRYHIVDGKIEPINLEPSEPEAS